MASTNKAKPQLLTITSLSSIHVSHPPIGKALQQIVDYINANVVPSQGTRIKVSK